MRAAAAILALALATPAHAEPENCDFQGTCYPAGGGQQYHMDLAHPDRVTPPPTPQYPAAHATPPPVAQYPAAPPMALVPADAGPPQFPQRVDPWCFDVERRLFATYADVAEAHARCDRW